MGLADLDEISVVTVTAIFVVHMASQSLAWLAMVPGWAALSIFLGGTVEEVAEWADNAWREI